MTKKELIENVAAETGVSKAAAEMAVKAVTTIIGAQMRQPGREVIIRGFGTFKSTHKPSYTGRNPKTGEPVTIPERIKVTFKASRDI